jgi:hypothetical protein
MAQAVIAGFSPRRTVFELRPVPDKVALETGSSQVHQFFSSFSSIPPLVHINTFIIYSVLYNLGN